MSDDTSDDTPSTETQTTDDTGDTDGGGADPTAAGRWVRYLMLLVLLAIAGYGWLRGQQSAHASGAPAITADTPSQATDQQR